MAHVGSLTIPVYLGLLGFTTHNPVSLSFTVLGEEGKLGTSNWGESYNNNNEYYKNVD